jgi:hypothetical protein
MSLLERPEARSNSEWPGARGVHFVLYRRKQESFVLDAFSRSDETDPSAGLLRSNGAQFGVADVKRLRPVAICPGG